MIATGNAALEVDDLRVTFDNPPRGVTAVDGVSFEDRRRERSSASSASRVAARA